MLARFLKIKPARTHNLIAEIVRRRYSFFSEKLARDELLKGINAKMSE